jgi:hypothetical protein
MLLHAEGRTEFSRCSSSFHCVTSPSHITHHTSVPPSSHRPREFAMASDTPPPVWDLDEQVSQCHECGRAFSLTVRKVASCSNEHRCTLPLHNARIVVTHHHCALLLGVAPLPPLWTHLLPPMLGLPSDSLVYRPEAGTHLLDVQEANGGCQCGRHRIASTERTRQPRNTQHAWHWSSSQHTTDWREW